MNECSRKVFEQSLLIGKALLLPFARIELPYITYFTDNAMMMFHLSIKVCCVSSVGVSVCTADALGDCALR